ncbi:MAG: type II toxin-antitoxin system PemK/MazF family toxin [Proteobacteria bacterium]|nr:MAG: type II toxin-antitoxin system PemK/MazF family toxin [Pseudomonadota bacterium]
MISGVPEAGDIITINFDPQSGSEINKRRPAIVLSSFEFNKKVGQAWICPVTSKPPRNPFHVILPADIKGFKYPDAAGEVANVKLEQLRSLDFRSRKATFVAKISSEFLNQCRSYGIRILGG